MPNASGDHPTLVIGGAGFMGLAIVEQLLLTDEPVLVFDTIPLPDDAVRLLKPIGPSLTAVQGSVCDRAALAALFERHPVKRIINCAAHTPTALQEKQDPRVIFEVNQLAVLDILQHARDRNLPFIQVSSSGSFGEIQFREGFDAETIGEDVLKDPISFYGISKNAAEQIVLRYGDLFGVDARIARVGVIWGPWEYATGVRHIFSAQLQMLRLAMKGEHARLGRDSIKDFGYVRDAGAGVVALTRAQNLRSKVFHISSAVPWTLMAFAEELCRHFPKFTYTIAKSGEAPNVTVSRAKDRVRLDISRIRDEAGFSPKFDLASSVADYVAWAKQTTSWRTE
jgi:nucleoside-diphosphate-sugar epimerase